MSAQKSSRKQPGRASQQLVQSALPQDIHSSAMSPPVHGASAKVQAIGSMSAKLSSAHAGQHRKIQTVGRDANGKLSAQRSSSRGHGPSIRGELARHLRTDRRPGMEDSLYSRPESRLTETEDQEAEEAKEATIAAAFAQHSTHYASRTGGPSTSSTGPSAISQAISQASALRDSHESMRSIQKQRIQRSLQKSQEGRRKLEEKLEAISSRDR